VGRGSRARGETTRNPGGGLSQNMIHFPLPVQPRSSVGAPPTRALDAGEHGPWEGRRPAGEEEREGGKPVASLACSER
jgi:hypothetical protein